jgi:hypothetical protein
MYLISPHETGQHFVIGNFHFYTFREYYSADWAPPCGNAAITHVYEDMFGEYSTALSRSDAIEGFDDRMVGCVPFSIPVGRHKFVIYEKFGIMSTVVWDDGKSHSQVLRGLVDVFHAGSGYITNEQGKLTVSGMSTRLGPASRVVLNAVFSGDVEIVVPTDIITPLRRAVLDNYPKARIRLKHFVTA